MADPPSPKPLTTASLAAAAAPASVPPAPPTPAQPQPPPASRPTASTNVPPSHATSVDPAVHATLLRDYARLKRRVEILEHENEGLRASLWEVSWRWGKQKEKQNSNDVPHSTDAPPPKDDSSPADAPAAARPVASRQPSTHSSAADATPTLDGSLHKTTASLETLKLTSPPPSAAPSAPASVASNHGPQAPTSPTPSSLAASLFPSLPPTSPHLPSSSRAYDRSTSLHRSVLPASLRRAQETHSVERWKWGRAYELKAHRGAVYTLKFANPSTDKEKGIMLASGGFDGIRIWRAKAEGEEAESDKWDEGDVEEVLHVTTHAGPVSDIAFSPTQEYLVSGGYDSNVQVTSLRSEGSPTANNTPTIQPSATFSQNGTGTGTVWKHSTDGLVQSVAWVEKGAMGAASESGNLFAWGTSGKVVGLADVRMKNIIGEWRNETGGMINSVQSFRRSAHLLVGDSLGQTLHFNLHTHTFAPDPTTPVPIPAGILSPPSTPAPRKTTAISCLATNPGWGLSGREERRWMASVGFDNFVRIWDRSLDPLKLGQPKLLQTLKGKNRNWPIKAAWFEGREYVDAQPKDKRRGNPSTSRSRSASFTGDRRHHSSDEDPDEPAKSTASEAQPTTQPLSSSLLLACGSSDPVVLLYDLSAVGATKSAGGAVAAGVQPQRLEGHKESVYAVDFLQARGPDATEAGEDSEEDVASQGGVYRGEGLLASGGGDWTVRLWKPHFIEAR